MPRSYSPSEYEEAATNVEAALRCGGKVGSHTLDRLPTMLREAAAETRHADARAAAATAMAEPAPPPEEPPPSTKPEKPEPTPESDAA